MGRQGKRSCTLTRPVYLLTSRFLSQLAEFEISLALLSSNHLVTAIRDVGFVRRLRTVT